MSIEALNWAWKVDGLTSTQKFVLIALADYADTEHGSCFPGQQKIADRVSCSVVTVSRALKVLEQVGLLMREERRREDGYRSSDRYILAVGKSPVNLTGEISPINEEGSHLSNSSDLTHQDDGAITTSSNHQIEPSEARAKKNQNHSSSKLIQKGSRIPEGWLPSREDVEAIADQCPGFDTQREHLNFMDYWISAPGAQGRKVNWSATWRKWMRTAYDRLPPSQRPTIERKVKRFNDEND